MEPQEVQGQRAPTQARAALQEQVHGAFSGRKPDEVLAYFSYVRSNYEIAASGLFKWVFTAISSVIVFQLLTLAAIKGATFGPVTVQNLGVVQKALPVFIAYSMYKPNAVRFSRPGTHDRNATAPARQDALPDTSPCPG